MPEGADAYLMRDVIHDWPDDDAARILEVVRRAMPSHGTLVVVERVLESPNYGPMAKFSDLNMLVATGGRERTQAEYAELYERAGLELTRVVHAGVYGCVEGSPAAP